MAFEKVAERKDKRKSGTTETQRWYERTYLAISDVPTGANAVKQAFGIPQMFTVYATSTETDLAARVVSLRASQISGTAKHWEVVVRYETRSGADEEGKWEKNPLNRPVRMSFSFQPQSVPVHGLLKQGGTITPDSTDVYQEPLVNAAKMEFSPQPEVEGGLAVLTVVRNEEFFDPAAAIEYNNTVNEDVFMNAQPRSMKVNIECPGGETAMVDDEEVVYYPVRYTFKWKPEGWDLRIGDRGPKYFDTGTTGSTTDLKQFEDNTGAYYIGWLTTGGTVATSTQRRYIQKEYYRKKPFADFNLPNQFI